MGKKSIRVNSKAPGQMGVDEELFGFVPSVPVMVTCLSAEWRRNIIPLISWSFANRWPPKITIGICEGEYTPSYYVRASYHMILATREFVVNFPDASLWNQIVLTGELSANDPSVDKFDAAGLTPGEALVVRAPLIEECPINIECIVREHLSLGSHHLFAGEVVAYHQYGEVARQESMGDLTLIDYAPVDGGPGKRLVWRSLPRLEDIAQRGEG